MASRVIEAGTIITRVRHLLQSGVLRTRPLWLDVVEAFPPFMDTKHNLAWEGGRPPDITYPEDELRVQFYRDYQEKRAETSTSDIPTEMRQELVMLEKAAESAFIDPQQQSAIPQVSSSLPLEAEIMEGGERHTRAEVVMSLFEERPQETTCDRFIELQQKFMAKGTDTKEAARHARKALKTSGVKVVPRPNRDLHANKVDADSMKLLKNLLRQLDHLNEKPAS